jgi:putative endonuclease
VANPSSVRAELVEALLFCFSARPMGFWAYMLHCADRSFYVGHTDDLDARFGAHQSGLIPGHTSTRRPVTLVWSDEFPSRYEALQAERQIKGWGRAKKLALIRGDWKLIRALARNTEEKERASTGSARTDERKPAKETSKLRSP